jgi:hypothetical protein
MIFTEIVKIKETEFRTRKVKKNNYLTVQFQSARMRDNCVQTIFWVNR